MVFFAIASAVDCYLVIASNVAVAVVTTVEIPTTTSTDA